MWFACTPRDLDWKAPYVIRNEAELDAPPDRVFAIWADLDQWPKWFPDIRGGVWQTPPPHGAHSRRDVTLTLLSVREQFLAWEPGRRFAFTMTASSLPLARSIVEEYRLEPLDGGRSRFVWEVRFDLRLPLVPASPLVRLVFGKMFRDATAGLKSYVSGASKAA